MKKEQKKYKGKFTRVIWAEILYNMKEDKVGKPRKDYGKKIYQRLVKNDESFRRRMVIGTDPEIKEFLSFTTFVKVYGMGTDSDGKKYETYRGVGVPVPFPSGNKDVIIHSQAYFDKIGVIDKVYNDIRNLDFKPYLGKSLDKFFKDFGELEKYFKYVEPTPPIRGDRQIIPVDMVKKIKGDIAKILDA